MSPDSCYPSMYMYMHLCLIPMHFALFSSPYTLNGSSCDTLLLGMNLFLVILLEKETLFFLLHTDVILWRSLHRCTVHVYRCRHIHVHIPLWLSYYACMYIQCMYTSQEGESYIASVVITAYIFFWCKQDDETLLERWKNENFTDLLQLHNKQPSWSDGEEKYDCEMECYRDQSTCMSF